MSTSDYNTVNALISNDPQTIEEFFFVRCRPMLVYVGQYFCQYRQSPEELIGEFYELLSADDWHKLRIFKFTCSLNSYVTIIASRYFQRKRDKDMLPLDADIALLKNLQDGKTGETFFMEDFTKVLKKLSTFDRFLVQRILIDGEKPRDILDEARFMLACDEDLNSGAETGAQFAGYVYTRYNRVRKTLQKHLTVIGYGK